ncbi:V-SNARE [Zalerion maritima]|uniref:V-SNARE n=1 Tax=Zalerion maritima TaxID=339359 RepID=A0AAD5RZS8_9PEZI|nr:V-SNARE [Zalerion maritima]
MKRDFEDTSIVEDVEADEDPILSGPSKKKSKRQKSKKGKPGQPEVDPTYGQRCVLAGEDGGVPSDDDLDCEDVGDAMAYLSSVRLEASTIPHLLVAPKRGPQFPLTPQTPLPPRRSSTSKQPPEQGSLVYDDKEEDVEVGEGTNDERVVDEGHADEDAYEYEDELDYSSYQNETGDFRGYYHDGAFTAVPDAWLADGDDDGWESSDSASSSDDDGIVIAPPLPSDHPSVQAKTQSMLRSSYFTSLVDRFSTLRAQLTQDPPAEAVADLNSKTHKTYVETFATKKGEFGAWNHRLHSTDPLPTQVASMGRTDVVRLLRVMINGSFFRRDREVHERTSRWTWALLARLPERGELDYQEVGYVRELGKKAVLMMRSLAEMEALKEVGVGGGSEEGDRSNGAPPGIEVYGVGGEEGGVADEKLSNENELQLEAEEAPSEGGKGEVPEDGEVFDEDEGDTSQFNGDDSLESAKARLIAQLAQPMGEATESDVSMDIDSDADSGGSANKSTHTEPQLDVETRASANTRATLNMILTVAGEFYGQRDLLEFRDPFIRS